MPSSQAIVSEIEIAPLPTPAPVAAVAAEAAEAEANPADQGNAPQEELMSFVQRARNDMREYQLLLQARGPVGASVYANRLQLVHMITCATDKAADTQCDYGLKSAYEHASQVILSGWVYSESNFRNMIDNTLADLAAGRIRFHSAKDQQHNDTVETLRNRVAGLSATAFEKEELVKKLQSQNKKIWAQNRLLHKVLSECAEKAGIDISIPDLDGDSDVEEADNQASPRHR